MSLVDKLLLPESDFSGKVVVVTGAGSGIGRETLIRFARAGATVIAADIDLEAAQRSADLAAHFEVDTEATRTDVGDGEDMQALTELVQQQFGGADVIVNNAGIGVSGKFLDTEDADWERVLRVNLWSVIRGSRLFAEQMLAHGRGGHIVNVASMAAYTPLPEMSAYATSKAAVQMLSDCLRTELSGQGIAVSSVCPGVVDTAITTSTRFVGVDDAEQNRRRQTVKALYQRRNLKPAAVAEAIFKAVQNRTEQVIVGAEAHAANWLVRLNPRMMRRLSQTDAGAIFGDK